MVGSATTGSYVVASLTAAAAVAGPIAGALIDRSPSARRGFAASMAVMAVGLLVIALLIGRVPVPVVLLLAVVAGTGYPALTGAWSAQIPTLVPPADIRRAYSADAATYSVAAVVAPPAATALVAFAPTAPLGLTIALLVASALLLRTVPLRTSAAPRQVSLRRELAEGIRAMTTIPALRRSTILTTVGFAGQAAIFVAAPILAEESGYGLGFTGVILGAFAVGGLLSAGWFARHPLHRADRAVIVNTALSGILLAAVGLAPTTPLLLVAAFAMGATEPPLVASMFQIRVRESPSHLQAQVFSSAASLRMTAFALATAASGWLLGWGVTTVIIFGVGLHALSLVLGMAFGPPLPKRRHWLHRG